MTDKPLPKPFAVLKVQESPGTNNLFWITVEYPSEFRTDPPGLSPLFQSDAAQLKILNGVAGAFEHALYQVKARIEELSNFSGRVER